METPTRTLMVPEVLEFVHLHAARWLPFPGNGAVTIVAAQLHEVENTCTTGFGIVPLAPDPNPSVVVGCPELYSLEETIGKVCPIVARSGVDDPQSIDLEKVGEEVTADEGPVETTRSPNHDEPWLEFGAAIVVVGQRLVTFLALHVGIVRVGGEVVTPIEVTMLPSIAIQLEILHVGDVLLLVHLANDHPMNLTAFRDDDLGSIQDARVIVELEVAEAAKHLSRLLACRDDPPRLVHACSCT